MARRRGGGRRGRAGDAGAAWRCGMVIRRPAAASRSRIESASRMVMSRLETLG